MRRSSKKKFAVSSFNLRRKGKFSGSIVCMGKTAASVLLKLFINGNERCHTSDKGTITKWPTAATTQNKRQQTLNMTENITLK